MGASVTAIQRTSAPAVTPISVAEAKAQCRVDHSDEDTLFGVLVDAAVAHVDALGELGRAIITQSWAQWVPQSPGYVRLVLGPFQSLDAVNYYDSDGTLQAATLSDYETRLSGDHVIVKPKEGYSWPSADSRADAIKLTYTVGFGDASTDVPDNIRQALLMLVAHLYENRETTTELNLRELPMGFHMLLGNERVSWYG